MSEKSATTYTVLHLRFKLRVPPDVFLARSRRPTVIASVEGLVWKIWILQQEELEIGGVYLFANRGTGGAPEPPGNPGRAQQSCCSIHRVAPLGCREFPFGSHAGSSAGLFPCCIQNQTPCWQEVE